MLFSTLPGNLLVMVDPGDTSRPQECSIHKKWISTWSYHSFERRFTIEARLVLEWSCKTEFIQYGDGTKEMWRGSSYNLALINLFFVQVDMWLIHKK